jgi:hypothetical protein
LELREYAFRPPPHPKWEMDGVHAEIAHHADLSAEFVLPFPIDRLGGIKVAPVPESAANFEQSPELTLVEKLPDFLHPWQKREFT